MIAKDNTRSSKIAIIDFDFPRLPLAILACYLAKTGYQVSVYTHEEVKKNKSIQNKKFHFGPSWLIPELALKEFYKDFSISFNSALPLKKPSINYKVFFDNSEFAIGSIKDTKYLFSQFEPGAGIELENYLRSIMKVNAKIESNGWGFIRLDDLYSRLNIHSRKLKSIFQAYELRRIMCIVPELFFGSYRFPNVSRVINYLNFRGEYSCINSEPDALFESILGIAKQHGVKFYTSKNLRNIKLGNGSLHKIIIGKKTHKFDYLIYGGNKERFQKITNKKIVSDKNTSRAQKASWQWSLRLDKKIPNLEFHNIFIDDTIQKFIQSRSAKFTKLSRQPASVYVDYYNVVSGRCQANICVSVTLPKIFADDLWKIAELKELILDQLTTGLQFDIRSSVLGEQEKIFDLAPASRLNQMIQATEHKNIYELKAPLSLEMMTAQAVYSSKLFSEQISKTS